MRHIDNSILKDSLQFFILQTRINMQTRSFIKTSVNVTETRIDEGAWKEIVVQSVYLEEHCTKIEIRFHLFYLMLLFLFNLVFKFTTFHLFYELLFLTNLVFKFNVVFIGIVFNNVNHNFLFCLLINIWYITYLEVFGVLYLKVFSLKSSNYVLVFSWKVLAY